jgi:hypothetical protein
MQLSRVCVDLVQIKLHAGYIGEFVRIRVRLDVNKTSFSFVSITRDNKKEWYQELVSVHVHTFLERGSHGQGQ